MTDSTTETGPTAPSGPPPPVTAEQVLIHNICVQCRQPLGSPHREDCPYWTRVVIVRWTVEYPVQVPHYMTAANIEFHRNEGGWCQDNAVAELAEIVGAAESSCALCRSGHFEYVREA